MYSKVIPLCQYKFFFISFPFMVYCCSASKSGVTILQPHGQAPLLMGFPRQEYWSGLPLPPPRDLPDPGIKLTSLALAGNSLPLSQQGSPPGLLQDTEESSLCHPAGPSCLSVSYTAAYECLPARHRLQGHPEPQNSPHM